MAHIGKRLKKAIEGIERTKLYPVDQAVKLVRDRATAKFDETVEIAMNLGVDPKHADQMVRGVVNLPNGTGRTLRVAVFARGAKAEEAKAAGADIVGAEDLVASVQEGKIEFDRCIATPDMMGLVGRLGKVLGPRGLMPNPRVGTVTPDVTSSRARSARLPSSRASLSTISAPSSMPSPRPSPLVRKARIFSALRSHRPWGRGFGSTPRPSLERRAPELAPEFPLDMFACGVPAQAFPLGRTL
jgi:hypothetical protein